MSSITFKLSTELRSELEKAAAQEGRTVSDFIRRHFTKKLLPPTKPAKRKEVKK